MSNATDPTAEALARILDRLDAIEAKVGGTSGLTPAAVTLLNTLADRLPTLTDAAGASAAFAWKTAEANGVDPLAAGLTAAHLAATLARPEHLAAAGRLTEKALQHTNIAERAIDAAPTLAKVLDRLDVVERATAQLPLLAKALDRAPLAEATLDAAADIDPAALRAVLGQGGKMLGKLAKILSAPEFQRLIDAADATTFGVAAEATTALVETRGAAPQPVGAFGALKAMGDPDVQKAVGFTLAVAKRFGQSL